VQDENIYYMFDGTLAMVPKRNGGAKFQVIGVPQQFSQQFSHQFPHHLDPVSSRPLRALSLIPSCHTNWLGDSNGAHINSEVSLTPLIFHERLSDSSLSHTRFHRRWRPVRRRAKARVCAVLIYCPCALRLPVHGRSHSSWLTTSFQPGSTRLPSTTRQLTMRTMAPRFVIPGDAPAVIDNAFGVHQGPQISGRLDSFPHRAAARWSRDS